MYIYYTNEEIERAMEKAINTQDWEKYILLQEEANIRGI